MTNHVYSPQDKINRNASTVAVASQ